MNGPANSQNSHQKRGGDGVYLGVVAGLLLLIIAMLATLWLRERSARIAAQRELTIQRRQLEQFQRILDLPAIEQDAETRPVERP